jgi:hypothetical protein
MRRKNKIIKPNDRQVVAIAQFHTGAGPMKDKRKDPKRRRLRSRLEERRSAASPED